MQRDLDGARMKAPGRVIGLGKTVRWELHPCRIRIFDIIV